jgi:putative ABC transport system permease protein
LLKAVGAGRLQILALFLTEATLLSVAGGLLGLLLGWALLQALVFAYPTLPAATPGWAVAGVILLAICTGPLFGALPAWRASRLDPVSTLSGS